MWLAAGAALCYASGVEEGLLAGLRWRWLRSGTRHRLVHRSGLFVRARDSRRGVARRWAAREVLVYTYTVMRCLAERRAR